MANSKVWIVMKSGHEVPYNQPELKDRVGLDLKISRTRRVFSVNVAVHRTIKLGGCSTLM